LNNYFEQNESESNKMEINNYKNSYNISKSFIENKSIKNLNINTINIYKESKLLNITKQNSGKTESDNIGPIELRKLFNNSITHILKVRTFFPNNKGNFLGKMEFNYFKNDLANNGIDINKILKGCLDCLDDVSI